MSAVIFLDSDLYFLDVKTEKPYSKEKGSSKDKTHNFED